MCQQIIYLVFVCVVLVLIPQSTISASYKVESPSPNSTKSQIYLDTNSAKVETEVGILVIESAVSDTENREDGPLDLDSMTTKLRSTRAIGPFTKLSLKKKINKLGREFNDYHEGNSGSTLDQLRERFDLLYHKVVILLQDGDEELSREIAMGREAIWAIFAIQESPDI